MNNEPDYNYNINLGNNGTNNPLLASVNTGIYIFLQ